MKPTRYRNIRKASWHSGTQSKSVSWKLRVECLVSGYRDNGDRKTKLINGYSVADIPITRTKCIIASTWRKRYFGSQFLENSLHGWLTPKAEMAWQKDRTEEDFLPHGTQAANKKGKELWSTKGCTDCSYLSNEAPVPGSTFDCVLINGTIYWLIQSPSTSPASEHMSLLGIFDT